VRVPFRPQERKLALAGRLADSIQCPRFTRANVVVPSHVRRAAGEAANASF